MTQSPDANRYPYNYTGVMLKICSLCMSFA